MAFKFTDQQKSSIKFLVKFNNLTTEQIRIHESMIREDGSFHRIETIRRWINRFLETDTTDS